MLITTLTLFLCALCYANAKPPNIVLFITDDQDAVMDGMSPMKNVQRFISNEGVTFTNSFVASPICCPSRASILTGLYPHNHKTWNNSMSGGCYGQSWREHEMNTFANILKNEANYTTFYAGKYLNEYGVPEAGGPSVVPPGWTEWRGLVGNSVYYDYVISNNGVPTYSNTLYLTDVLRDLSVTFIEEYDEEKPFLIVVAPPAPHAPFTPANRHHGFYANHTVARPPNFNVPAEDKHWLLRMPPSPLPDSMLPELDKVFRSRWEALLSVDEMVADVIGMLDSKGHLDDTYVVFTSDNGFHIGQFSQVYDKRQPYESDIRVPLTIRGPNVPKNSTNSSPIVNIDLAPTILKMAGLTPPPYMDGTAIDFDATINERNMLVEYRGEQSLHTVDPKCPWSYDQHLSQCWQIFSCKCEDARNNTFACVRHLESGINLKFCQFNDTEQFEEIYDIDEDPYELNNLVNSIFPSIRILYKTILENLAKCQGAAECNNVE